MGGTTINANKMIINITQQINDPNIKKIHPINEEFEAPMSFKQNHEDSLGDMTPKGKFKHLR